MARVSLTQAITALNVTTDTNTANISVKDSSFAVQGVLTKNSGTLAGTAYLRGSVDGTNFQKLDATNLSFTITDTASQNFIFNMRDQNYEWIDIIFESITGDFDFDFYVSAKVDD